MSPALKLFYHTCEHAGHQMGRSNLRWDHTKQAAITLAIRYGLRFDVGDFAKLADSEGNVNDRRPGYYATEHDYALAAGSERGVENMSACLSIEKHWKRKPFLLRDPDLKTPTRVYIGRQFRWEGELLTVTSFAKDQSHFVACGYEAESETGMTIYFENENWGVKEARPPNPETREGWALQLAFEPFDWDAMRKVKRRMKITHDDIKKYHANLRAAEAPVQAAAM